MAAVVSSARAWRSEFVVAGNAHRRWRPGFTSLHGQGCGATRPLVVRCRESDPETPKPRSRRKKAADPSTKPDDATATPKIKKEREARAAPVATSPTDVEEDPTVEKKKKTRKRAAPKSKIIEMTAVEIVGEKQKDSLPTRKEKIQDKGVKDRWQLMEEEKLKVIEGRYLTDEEIEYESEEEEEESEGDDDAEEEQEEKPKQENLDVVDMKFPEKESYALIESYKPRKIGKDERPPLSNDELWWNWKNRRPDEHVWSEFQKRPGLPDITMAAMAALTGQIKLFGDTPTVTETHIYRARKFVFKEERLAAEARRRDEIGAMAYYQEWVKAWDKDTSKEAVQKHYDETGEDVAQQLMNMLACQTQREYRQMMGTDVRIKRDPLVMRATPEMKKSVFGGDPVYPTINYIKKPGEIPDYRGPNFHQPRPNIIEHLIRGGRMKTRAEHNRLMALQQQRLEAAAAKAEEDEEVAEEMAAAIDIGDKDTEEDDEEEDGEDDEDTSFKQEIISVPTEKLIGLPQEEEEEDDGSL